MSDLTRRGWFARVLAAGAAFVPPRREDPAPVYDWSGIETKLEPGLISYLPDGERIVDGPPVVITTMGRCPYEFGSPHCGYGDPACDRDWVQHQLAMLEGCDKTIADCIERGNVRRFGGFPQ